MLFEAIVRVMDQVYEGAVIYGIHSESFLGAGAVKKTVGLTWPAPDVEETERLIQKLMENESDGDCARTSGSI